MARRQKPENEDLIDVAFLVEKWEKATNRFIEDEKFILSLLDQPLYLRLLYYPLMVKMTKFLRGQLSKYEGK